MAANPAVEAPAHDDGAAARGPADGAGAAIVGPQSGMPMSR